MSHGIKRDIMRVRVTKATHPTAWYVDQVGLEFNVVKSLASGWYDVLDDIFKDGQPRRHIRIDDCEVVSKNQPASDAATGVSDAAMREAHDFLKQVDEPGTLFGDVATTREWTMTGPGGEMWTFTAEVVGDGVVFDDAPEKTGYDLVAEILGVSVEDLLAAVEKAWPDIAHPLRYVFEDAVAQAASGKGNERHGNGADFLEQPWVSLTEGFGIGGPMFQASKKLRESMKFYHAKEYDRFEREVLGALNYAAMAVLHARKEKNNA